MSIHEQARKLIEAWESLSREKKELLRRAFAPGKNVNDQQLFELARDENRMFEFARLVYGHAPTGLNRHERRKARAKNRRA